MLEFDTRKALSTGAVSTVAAPPRPAALAGRVRGLSAEAQKVAAEPVAPAYSPIVLAGFVRMIDADAAELAVRRLHSLYGLDK